MHQPSKDLEQRTGRGKDQATLCMQSRPDQSSRGYGSVERLRSHSRQGHTCLHGKDLCACSYPERLLGTVTLFQATLLARREILLLPLPGQRGIGATLVMSVKRCNPDYGRGHSSTGVYRGT